MSDEKVVVAVDAMGGDDAPGVVLDGVAQALASDPALEIVLCGPADVVEPFAAAHERCTPQACSEVIAMAEHPANADCKPEYLVQFGQMASIYAEKVIGIEHPRAALLNIGEEDTKGSQFAQEAHGLLRERLSNFAGNAEGSDILPANFDVIITDGFTGNVCLKTIEGTSKTLFKTLKSIMMSTPLTKLGALAIKGGLKQLMAQVSPDTYGGAPLLGVKGALLVGHGSSNALAVKNGVLTTARIARTGVSDIIAQTVATPCAAEATEGE